MLHAKFQGNWPSGSGEEDFLGFWAFLSMAAILVMWHWIIYINFRSPFPRRIHIKFGFDWPSGFWESKF